MLINYLIACELTASSCIAFGLYEGQQQFEQTLSIIK